MPSAFRPTLSPRAVPTDSDPGVARCSASRSPPMTAQEGEDHRSTGPSEEELRRLWQGALGTLLANWRGMSTVPSSYLYPHQWSWDSAFIGLGMARWHQQRAQSELRTVFAG